MKKWVLILLLFCVAASISQAQTRSFIAYNEQNQTVQTICVGQRITFKDNTTRSQDPNFAEFYYIGTSNTPIDQPYVFTAPGTYVVRQLANGFDQRQESFVVKANAPSSAPLLQKLSLQGTGIQIQVQTSAVNDLIVERAASATAAFTPLDTLRSVPAGSSQHTFNLSNPASCYRLRVTNICTGQENITSGTVCSQGLQVAAGDRRNIINWSANGSSSPVSQYQLLRAGSVYQTLSGSQTSFTDAQVACGRNYRYQIVAVLANGSQSVSLEHNVTTEGTTPSATPFLVVSFNHQNQPVVQSVIPVNETFQYQSVYRSLKGSAFSLISEKQPKNATDTSLPDFTALPCYQVSYLDSCNAPSRNSNTVCPAILKASFQDNGSVQLNWNQYEGFSSGIASQTLELLDEQGNVYWSTPVTGTSYTDAQPQDQYQRLTYRLLTKAQNAAYESYSNTASVDQAFQFYLPNAFSPNGDGLNDVFRALGRFASEFNFQVLNRWGQVIFESHDPQRGWDGTYLGKPSPLGTYLFRLEATDVNGQRISKKGKVTLVR